MSCGRRIPQIHQKLLSEGKVQSHWKRLLLIACTHGTNLSTSNTNELDHDPLVKGGRAFFLNPEGDGYCIHYTLRVCEPRDEQKSKHQSEGSKAPLIAVKETFWADDSTHPVEIKNKKLDSEACLRVHFKTFCPTASETEKHPDVVAIEFGHHYSGKVDPEVPKKMKSALAAHWFENMLNTKGETVRAHNIGAANWPTVDPKLVATADGRPLDFDWGTELNEAVHDLMKKGNRKLEEAVKDTHLLITEAQEELEKVSDHRRNLLGRFERALSQERTLNRSSLFF